MRLWTIQDPRVWEVLRETGHFRADGRRVYKWFRPAYRWMVGQMERRLPGYHKGRYPVWAWHTPKPDMRMSSYRLPPGEEGVRLTLEIPDEEAAVRVLRSGFEDWHSPLNNRYLWPGSPRGSPGIPPLCYPFAIAPLRPSALSPRTIRLPDPSTPLLGPGAGGEPAVQPAAAVYGLVQTLVPDGRSVAVGPVSATGSAPGSVPLRGGPPETYLSSPRIVAGH